MALERVPVIIGGVPAPSTASVVPGPTGAEYLLMRTGTGVTDYSWGIQLSYMLDRANHTGVQDASTITTGIFDIARIPVAAVPKLVTVADQIARYALTTAQVQNGDTVKQTDTDVMYYVIDDTNLNNAAGYTVYKSYVDWSTVANKPQIIVDIAAIASPSANDFISYVGGAWVKQTLAQVKTTLGVTNARVETFELVVGDETTAITTGTGKRTFYVPYDITVTEIFCGLSTQQATGSTFTVDVNKNGSSVFTTVVTIDNAEDTSLTAAVAPVLSATAWVKGDKITVDVDQVGDGTATGLKVYITGNKAA